MKKLSILLATSLIIASPVFAQDDLVPATNDDIQTFDDQVSEGDAPATDTQSDKQRKDNFGAKVSAEAHRLKELPKEERHKMGEWVSAQRRKDGDKKMHGQGQAAAGNGSTMGGGADARSSAPKNNNSGKPDGVGRGGSNRGR